MVSTCDQLLFSHQLELGMGASLKKGGGGDLSFGVWFWGQFGHSFDSLIWAHSCHDLDKRIN